MKTTPMISKNRVIAFAMACCLLLLPGCVEDKPLVDTESEAATQAEETTTEETTTEESTTQTEATSNDEANDEAMAEEHAGWEIPANPEQYLYPSQEEIDQAMMQEAQEAMQKQYEQYEQYYDYDSSLGKRGR